MEFPPSNEDPRRNLKAAFFTLFFTLPNDDYPLLQRDIEYIDPTQSFKD